MGDKNESERSAMEERLSRLIVPAPGTDRISERIDWIHDPDLVLRINAE